ncbi:hypothetical protein GO495_19865 [Chitinophaga oryziterrae]|uniref:JAB domain-containing protein n=1 Tax=Chitinophaga oryziterrae TaxID=1031224 RepID=A0A6N8JFH4_9BACT|nr:Mov34/MPN/PAD-1 family protein [Chitinophaga oryziterrae]MVT42862.1 hypothetical protein [Chitinophaga oryziterrae]
MKAEQYKVDDYIFHISDTVLDIMKSFIQDAKWKPESGGILLGQVKDKQVYVQKASVPCLFDRGSRYAFHRDKAAAQIIVNYEFVNSSRTVTYLGEWHTHPEEYPNPSPQDLRMINGQHALGELHIPFLIMAIQGISGRYVGMYKNNHLSKAVKL